MDTISTGDEAIKLSPLIVYQAQRWDNLNMLTAKSDR